MSNPPEDTRIIATLRAEHRWLQELSDDQVRDLFRYSFTWAHARLFIARRDLTAHIVTELRRCANSLCRAFNRLRS